MVNKDISKIKMVALTKNGHPNVTWYSPYKQNKKDNQFIINGMMTRFQKHKEYNHTNVIQFYSQTTGEKIQEYKRQN